MLDEILVKRVKVPWTSSSGGAATIVLDKQNGVFLRAQPTGGTQNYALTIKDDQGEDLLNGQGATVNYSAVKSIYPNGTITDGTNNGVIPPAVASTLTVGITGAGNGASGNLYLYFR